MSSFPKLIVLLGVDSSPDQTIHFLRDGSICFPHALTTFLQSPVYVKIGVNIAANFKHLQADCVEAIHGTPFSGHRDLGLLAQSCHAAPRGSTSLPVLCSLILRHQLTTDPQLCVSASWDDVALGRDFVDHAALEVFAVWSVYTVLQNMGSPQPVNSLTPGGTKVTMFAPDGREIAHGVIALDRPATFHGINVTQTRVLMVVQQVLVPAYLISGMLTPSHEPTPLSAFGEVSFVILCQASHLCTSTSCSIEAHSDALSPLLIQDHPPALDWAQLSATSEAADSVSEPGNSVEGRFALWEGMEDSEDNDSEEQLTSQSERDPVAYEAIRNLVLAITRFDPDSMTVLRSRILGDIWYLFHQFPISLHHGLWRPFSCALSAAIFFTDPGDKLAVEAFLQKSNTTYEARLLSKPKWILARVCCFVPPPEILFSRVASVIKTFGPLKDSTTGQPLFSEKAWDVTKNILEHIRHGDYSDPPEIPLYFEIGKDKHGLTLYRCCRGTNDLEGGVHQNLIWRFTSFNVSPQCAVNMILDYAVCHNMQVILLNSRISKYNRTHKSIGQH